MGYAQLASVSTGGEWLQTERFITWRDMVHFRMEVQGILTPFRGQVLNYIYRTARGLSGSLLESVIVEPIIDPDEENSLHLHLALTVNMDWDSLDQLHDQILARVSEWSRDWTEDEQEDYGRWIYFSLTPSNI